jgi:hypothetical protein
MSVIRYDKCDLCERIDAHFFHDYGSFLCPECLQRAKSIPRNEIEENQTMGTYDHPNRSEMAIRNTLTDAGHS